MNEHTDALANVYAKSLVDLADEQGGRDLITEVGEELQAIVALADEDARFGEFLVSIIVPADKRAQSLKNIFTGQVTDLTLHFLLVVNRKGRLGHLRQIELAYRALREEKFGYVAVAITTAHELSGEQVLSLTERLRQSLNREPIITTMVSPDLIGGMKVQIGDQLIDASVASHLRRLQQQMTESGVQTIRDRAEELIDTASE
jgi:F-type H+-transporting ATPase subunit delta